ncbi:hypothetical protein ACRAKI_14100 [Saccharothrix isguenensis]
MVLSQVPRGPAGGLQALVFGGAGLFLVMLWYAWFVFRRDPFIGSGKPISE